MLRILFTRNKHTKKNIKEGTPEYFWHWFVIHCSEFEAYLATGKYDLTVAHQVNSVLKKYNALLVGEFSMDKYGRNELVISPDGHSEAIDAVHRLVDAAPKLDKWKFIGFKPPSELDGLILKVNDLSYPQSDLSIKPQIVSENGAVDVHIYIRNMEKNEASYQQLAFLYLTHAAGEYNMLKRVRLVEFFRYSELNERSGALNLKDFQEWMWREFL